MASVNVIGFDLSITATGLCPGGSRALTAGGPSGLGDRRISIIKDEARRLLAAGRLAGRPYDLGVIEGPGFSSTRLFAVAMVHGVVRDALMDFGVPYALIAPNALKRFATGNGGADKPAMLAAARQHTDLRFADDNQVDAWWLWRMGAAHLGDIAGLNPAQVSQVAAIEWPVFHEQRSGRPMAR